MQFIDSIVLRETPPAQFKKPGAVWVDSGRLKHETYDNEVKTIAYTDDVLALEFHQYDSGTTKELHIINHGLGTRTPMISVQEFSGSFPHEYIDGDIYPTPGDEENSTTIEADIPVRLFATLLKVGP